MSCEDLEEFVDKQVDVNKFRYLGLGYIKYV